MYTVPSDFNHLEKELFSVEAVAREQADGAETAKRFKESVSVEYHCAKRSPNKKQHFCKEPM